jgi:hypothetical protein
MPVLVFKNSKLPAGQDYVLEAVETGHLDAVIASLADDGWVLDSIDDKKPTPKVLTDITKEN